MHWIAAPAKNERRLIQESQTMFGVREGYLHFAGRFSLKASYCTSGDPIANKRVEDVFYREFGTCLEVGGAGSIGRDVERVKVLLLEI